MDRQPLDRRASGAGMNRVARPGVDHDRRRVVGAALLLGCAATPIVRAVPGIPAGDRGRQVGFESEAAAAAVERHFGSRTYADGLGKIRLSVEATPRDGAIVPVVVESELDAAEIAIVVENGPDPLAAVFDLPPGTEAYVSARVRVRKESRLAALVKKRNGTLHGVSQEVRARVPGFPD